MKRREDELYYDYCFRRLLGKEEVTNRGMVIWQANQWIAEVSPGGRVLTTGKVVVLQGTYVRGDKVRKGTGKLDKKRARKLKREFLQEALCE